MVQRIVINTKELSRSFWELTYAFIQDCINGKVPDLSYCVTYSVSFFVLDGRPGKTYYQLWIIYQKDNYQEDFSDMVPFLMITRGLPRLSATLAIDLDKVPFIEKEQGAYIFKCSEFFRFMDVRDNKSHRILFLNEKALDKETGAFPNFSKDGVSHLRMKKGDPASRKYLPLIEVSNANFGILFENEPDPEVPLQEAVYMREIIEKTSSAINAEVKHYSLFEEWFVRSFFFYLKETFKGGEIDYNALEDILHIYCSNIYELVQNIIFHTKEKKGLMFFAFNKESDLSIEQKAKLNLSTLHEDGQLKRFLTFGIIDYNDEGISESFNNRYKSLSNTAFKLELEDFFSPKVLPTKGLTHLDLRRMAHIGLPVLMSTIRNYNGYFRVESNRQQQKAIIELQNGRIVRLGDRKYVNGTHYEILLPIVPSKETPSSIWSLHQKSSILNRVVHYKESGLPLIPIVNVADLLGRKDETPLDKEHQTGSIESVGNRILESCGDSPYIAIDCGGDFFAHPTTIVKLVSYLQMEGGVNHPVIVLTSLTDELMDHLCSVVKSILIDSNISPIWNSKSAIILMTRGLRYQVFSGSTRKEIYAINSAYQKYYYSNKNYFETKVTPKAPNADQDSFILPYELLIGDSQGSFSNFYSYVRDLLKHPVEKKSMGYCLKLNTYIGNKLIVRYFYEADSLFQNSFFTDRFAFIAAERIKRCVKPDLNLAIVGYKFYSEQLIKTTAQYLKRLYKIDSIVLIADEDNTGQVTLNISDKSRNELRKGQFATIVPIGATLSTNDKIIAVINSQIGGDANVVYNQCSIVVRDIEVQETPTDFEKDQKWDLIDFRNQIVHTRFENAKEIHYDILVGAMDAKESNWLRRPNSLISLPNDYVEEEYVNHTENASINSQNLMGLPSFDIKAALGDSYDHVEELRRLLDMRKDIYSGHIQYYGAHFRYYFDTESYVHRSTKMFNSWLDSLAQNAVFESSRFNIIITPNARIEADFVNLVNEKVFGGNALILFFDVNNWKSDNINKFSYITKLVTEKGNDIHFHYVDHSFFTASTYKKTKSYLRVLCPNGTFKTGTVVINRLNYDIREEIRQDFGGNLFVYFNLFAPETGDTRSRCSQCDLSDYYLRLVNSTALTACREIIGKNQERIEKKSLSELKLHGQAITDRRFLRLFFAHEISYKVSSTEFVQSLDEILKPLYDELFLDTFVDKSDALSLLNEQIPDTDHLYNKRISFLKALSSPPLSRYILVREYAHRTLLKVLAICLHKKETDCQYDDFRMLKAVLKSLSFYKSNAIIRKEVILNSWKIQELLFKKTKEELQNSKPGSLFWDKYAERLNKLNDFGKYYQFYIKNAVFEDGSKSCFLGELLRTGEEKRESPLMVSQTMRKDANELSKQLSDNEQFQAFLVDVFYDNTTITRRTLADFERELSRNKALSNLFFEPDEECNGSQRQLYDFSTFREKIEDAANQFKDIVLRGYYYSDFVPYVTNKDNYKFVEKFCCLLFLRLKFKQLHDHPLQDISIEQELTEFLEGFSYLMDADYCLYAGGEAEEVYVLDYSAVRAAQSNESSKSRGTRFPHESYVNRLFSKKDLASGFFIEKDSLRQSDKESEKAREFKYVCNYIINTKSDTSNKGQAICFFFKERVKTEIFLTHLNEGARLLLLLRQEIDDFFIGFLLKEKVIDLWIDKIESSYKFEKIYDDSAHVFRSVFKELEEFDRLPHEYLRQMARTWYWLTNETISYFYANIEKNVGRDNLHYLELGDNSEVLSGEDTLQEVFSDEFICLVSQLLIDRWVSKMCSISINGTDIKDFKNTEIPRTLLHCKRHVIQVFLVQCLHNSLGVLSQHGHRGDREEKHVAITVEKDRIVLKDITRKGGYSEDDMKAIVQAFSFQSQQIRELNCKHYSSTTLTSIQGFIKHMQRRHYNYDFDFGFDDKDKGFFINIQVS